MKQMFETPMISAPTADSYQRALKALVDRAQEFLSHEDVEDADLGALARHARQIRLELHKDGHQPRQKLTRLEVVRSALRQLAAAIEEYEEVEQFEGGALELRPWEALESAVRSGARSAERYATGGDTWAPEDDETNPHKTMPVPVPDPSADPINGVRQGDWVKVAHEDEPRRVLTGVEEGGFGPHVRLSDPRDGTYFGGFWVRPDAIGSDYVRVEGPPGA